MFDSQPCSNVSIPPSPSRAARTHQSLKQSLARRRAAPHHVPELILARAEHQTLLDLLRRHRFTSPVSNFPGTRCRHSSPPCMSCLFANTSSSASFISLSNMILWSSCLASSILDRSFESMTKIRPCVPASTSPVSHALLFHPSCPSALLMSPYRKSNASKAAESCPAHPHPTH